MIHVDFSPSDCTPCPSRPSCTRAKNLPRSLTLHSRAEHETIQALRGRQRTEEFASLYVRRAGIEGTFSQGVGSFGLRQARYRSLTADCRDVGPTARSSDLPARQWELSLRLGYPSTP